MLLEKPRRGAALFFSGGLSWKTLREFRSPFFVAQRLHKLSKMLNWRDHSYRILCRGSDVVVAECVNADDLLHDWNALVIMAANPGITESELLSMGFNIALAHACHLRNRDEPSAAQEELMDGRKWATLRARKKRKGDWGLCLQDSAVPQSYALQRRPSIRSSIFPGPRPINFDYFGLRILSALRREGFLDDVEFELQRRYIMRQQHTRPTPQAPVNALPAPHPSGEASASHGTNGITETPPSVEQDSTAKHEERAVRFDYNPTTREWIQTGEVFVVLASEPFERGTFREAYMLQMPREPEGQRMFVAKKFREEDDDDEDEETDRYHVMVEMQALCKQYASQYNTRNPPKRVDFLDSFLIELADRPRRANGMRPTRSVEPFLAGTYHKHNNNLGFTSYLERNTPQAFSHFTYVASGGKHLVVDIQGVGDAYTDPQVHSSDGQGFGEGNWGQHGIDKFFASHLCNSLCRYLRLPARQTKSADDDAGTCVSGSFVSTKSGASFVSFTRGLTLPPRVSASPSLSSAATSIVETRSTSKLPVQRSAALRSVSHAPSLSPFNREVKGNSFAVQQQHVSGKSSLAPGAGGSANRSRTASVATPVAQIPTPSTAELTAIGLSAGQYRYLAEIFVKKSVDGKLPRAAIMPLIRELGLRMSAQHMADMLQNLREDGPSLSFWQFICFWTGIECPSASVTVETNNDAVRTFTQEPEMCTIDESSEDEDEDDSSSSLIEPQEGGLWTGVVLTNA
eukprot:TRINITY_DN9177_c0_g1_i1.p1 TRINITY_DN9177_c0_g1~~TRINITY_DN9177_c0_g1_i1.p1  ORF type:complete len:743 (+),score=81.78 TRINITY_DN9177_c0_g1_i1:68-2296(+)